MGMRAQLIIIGLLAIVILVSGCTGTLENLQNTDSIKDIQQNTENYINKEVTIRGEAKGSYETGLVDSEGYYLIILNCDRAFEKGKIYTVTGIVRDYEWWPGQWHPAVDCSLTS